VAPILHLIENGVKKQRAGLKPALAQYSLSAFCDSISEPENLEPLNPGTFELRAQRAYAAACSE
jgi:hypothetical protein